MEQRKTHYDTYTLTVSCCNCDFTGNIQIQKGSQVAETLCPKCQCLTLSKHADQIIPTTGDINSSETENQKESSPDDTGLLPQNKRIPGKSSEELSLEETHKRHDKKFGRIGVFRHRPF